MPTSDAISEEQTDVLIVGGGVGGCAAALAVGRLGYRAIMTEESDWIGGQLTSQAVPPDEHGWIEYLGCTRSYRDFRNAVREFYRQNYPLTDTARSNRYFNPGGGWVSPLCHEPRVAVAVLERMLAPYVQTVRTKILRRHRCIAVGMQSSDQIANVVLECMQTGHRRTIHARYFLDASELGDLLPLCGAEFVTGSESQQETGEPSAPIAANPKNSQAFSWCFAVGYKHGANHTIERLPQYDTWKSFAPELTPPWPGRLFSWTAANPRSLEPVQYRFEPNAEGGRAFEGLWSYRRILDRSHFTPGTFASDICLINWPMIDHWLGDLCTSTTDHQQLILLNARQQSLAFLYWLQTEAPRQDGGYGFPGLYLCPQAMGTADGLAMSPYIRESRRIRSTFVVTEQHVSARLRPNRQHAQFFADSVGIGYYRIDLHPTCGGDNYLDVPALPFQIPLGSMIPIRIENLLPAAKNIGVTHITNGCYRLHPVEWNIGEAAGALACFCLDRGTAPRGVQQNPARLTEFQDGLLKQGFELQWPNDICLDHGDPHRHATQPTTLTH